MKWSWHGNNDQQNQKLAWLLQFWITLQAMGFYTQTLYSPLTYSIHVIKQKLKLN